MNINMFNYFKKRNNLGLLYPLEHYRDVEVTEGKYPLFISLKSESVYAYKSRFLTKSEDAEKVKEVIASFFECYAEDEYGYLYKNNNCVNYHFFEELGFVGVDLITNNIMMIEAVCSMNIPPPSFQDVFPSMDYEGIGSLQGSVEYWWNVYWLPFWKALNRVQRETYIEKKGITESVIKFMRCHE
jgi:hypothetical protein